MKRCIDDLYIISHLPDHFRMNDLLFQLFHISVVDLFANHLIQAFIHGFLLIHGLHIIVIRYRAHFLDDLPVLWSRHLGAILPVRLIAVILRRIMTCCHYNTGNAAKLPDREGKLRCGAQRVKHVGLDTICRQTKCRLIRKLRGHSSGVIGNGHPLFLPTLL